MKTIRWGIIGCGDVTEIKSGPGLQKADYSSLVAVMRRNGDLARDYAQRHGVPRGYDNGEALINDPEVDAVYIATPPNVHKEYTFLAAQAGKPIYVEKPMAMNFAECQAMMAACQSVGVPLFVAYYRRALPRFLKIKELVESGAIGDVRFVSITLYQKVRPSQLDHQNLPWRIVPEIAGAGVFMDLACHTLDFLDYLLGPIRSTWGTASNQAHLYAAEDIVSGSFVFESGVHGIGTWCFTAFEDCDQVKIVGSKGKISFSTFGLDDPVILNTDEGTASFPVMLPAHVQQPLIQSIVHALNGVGVCSSTGESAARTSWVMDQMLESYRDRFG